MTLHRAAWQVPRGRVSLHSNTDTSCLPQKFNNVQAAFLKTAESAALPIYQSLPMPAKI